MKEYKPNHTREVKPSRNRLDRPDNGFKGVKEQGPSSGAWKNNPHKNQSLVQHAELWTEQIL